MRPYLAALLLLAACTVAETPPPIDRTLPHAGAQGTLAPGATLSLSIEGRRPLLDGRAQAVPTPIRLAPRAG